VPETSNATASPSYLETGSVLNGHGNRAFGQHRFKKVSRARVYPRDGLPAAATPSKQGCWGLGRGRIAGFAAGSHGLACRNSGPDR
jgi:hypothetical protein